MFIKILESDLASVSGQWGAHSLSPRISNYGWGIVSTGVLNNPAYPQEIRDALAQMEQIEFNASDFPANEEEI